MWMQEDVSVLLKQKNEKDSVALETVRTLFSGNKKRLYYSSR